MTYEELKYLLKKRKITLKSFCKDCNLNYGTVTSWGISNKLPKWVEPFVKHYLKNLPVILTWQELISWMEQTVSSYNLQSELVSRKTISQLFYDLNKQQKKRIQYKGKNNE